MLAKTRNFLLLGSLVLIILGTGLVAILNHTGSPTDSSTDVRARAAVTKSLHVNATVTSVNQSDGTVVVTDVYFTDQSRSGDPKNFGSWTVTAPANFNLSTVSPGMNIVIGFDSKTFLATKHTLTALTIVPGTK